MVAQWLFLELTELQLNKEILFWLHDSFEHPLNGINYKTPIESRSFVSNHVVIIHDKTILIPSIILISICNVFICIFISNKFDWNSWNQISTSNVFQATPQNHPNSKQLNSNSDCTRTIIICKWNYNKVKLYITMILC